MDRVKGAAPLAVALVVAGLLVALLGFSSTLNPVDAVLRRGAVVDVPDVIGRPRPGAEAELRARGLVPEVRRTYNLTGARGSVIGQDPPAGSRLREGSPVTMLVSRGINRVEMPDAVGRPLSAIRGALDDAGVEVDVERTHDEAVPKGSVISQQPGPGVVVSGGDAARFVVSSGPAQRPVPDVTGLDVEGAAFLLGKAGLGVAAVNPTDDANRPVGTVIVTDPPAGTVVARDTPVAVAMAAGPPAVATPDVVGRNADAAAAAVRQVGLVANVIHRGGGATVTAQDPAGSTPARPGQVVTITVGGGA